MLRLLCALALGTVAFCDQFEAVAARAQEARNAARLDEAAVLYREALALRPDWDEGWWYLGTTEYSSDRHQGAIDALRKLLDRRPEHGPAWAVTGLCRFELKQYDAAVEDLQRARMFGVTDNPLLLNMTRYTLGILLNRFGGHEEALQVLQALAADQPESDTVLAALGISALLMPLLPSDIPPEKRELVLLAGRAEYFAARKQIPEASRVFERMLARFPAEPNVHFAFADFLIGQETDRAISQYRRELEINPSNVMARLRLALEHLRRGEVESALPYARQAAGQLPDWYVTRQTLGRVLLAAGDAEGAIAELEAARNLLPENAQTRLQLSRAYRLAGRREDAAREEAEFDKIDRNDRGRKYGPRAVAGRRADDPADSK
jgi:tetratricopeptide (TPR) repeat protein